MILSDRSIKESVASGRIIITPYDEALVQPASVDIRLDGRFLVFRNYKYSCIDPKAPQQDLTEMIEVADDEPFIVHPGEFILGSTVERIGLGSDIAAQLGGKSSLGRLGLIVHATAGFIDPGFEGSVTLELSNVANLPIRLYPGMKVGQISFFAMTTAADRPYGHPSLGSKYKGQTVPTASRMHLNFPIEEDNQMTIQDYQVLQRDADGKARVTLDSGETLDLPVGGPYEVGGAKNVLVGDLWILAGQSNMEGVGDLVDVETPHPLVHSFQSRERWAPAEEPLHWLGESPRPVHHIIWGQPVPDRDPAARPQPDEGCGPGPDLRQDAGGPDRRPRRPDPRRPRRDLHAAVGPRPQRAGRPFALRRDSGTGPRRRRQSGGNPLVSGRVRRQPDRRRALRSPYDRAGAVLPRRLGQPDLPFYYVQLGGFVSDPFPEIDIGLEQRPRVPAHLAEQPPKPRHGFRH